MLAGATTATLLLLLDFGGEFPPAAPALEEETLLLLPGDLAGGMDFLLGDFELSEILLWSFFLDGDLLEETGTGIGAPGVGIPGVALDLELLFLLIIELFIKADPPPVSFLFGLSLYFDLLVTADFPEITETSFLF